VDHAIQGLNISGQWAHEASSALTDGDFSGLSEGFIERVNWIEGELGETGDGLSRDGLIRMTCEIYREDSPRLSPVTSS
jgi:hypothetical protein